jgi:uncharacterized protein (UPF0261 family)
LTDRIVLVLATLDTKGAEAGHLAAAIRAHGIQPLVLDLSVFGEPSMRADLARDAVAAAAGETPDALAKRPRADALEAMARGATRLATALAAEARLVGVVALGGSQGTVAGTRVMAALPFGLPKLMVSTMASGNTRLYVGTSDIAMLFPVVDLSGLNRFCRAVLDNAAAAIAGMARAWRAPGAPATREVALTMFGATTGGVSAVAARLRESGVDPVVFHANGTGGRALEEWIERGEFHGVLDLTTTELADELAGGHRSAGPDRVGAAGRRGLPQLIAPGAIDMVNFGAPDTVPAKYSGRRLHPHNPGTTLMRTTADENTRLGQWMAAKLNRATGPTGVVIPRGGFSAYDAPGGPFWDPDADRAFRDALLADLDSRIPRVEVDANINDRAFVDVAVALWERLSGGGELIGSPSSPLDRSWPVGSRDLTSPEGAR